MGVFLFAGREYLEIKIYSNMQKAFLLIRAETLFWLAVQISSVK